MILAVLVVRTCAIRMKILHVFLLVLANLVQMPVFTVVWMHVAIIVMTVIAMNISAAIAFKVVCL
jgi:hypothetical protein